MVELVLLACLLRQPTHCEEFRIPFAAATMAPQCVWQSLLRAAQWSGDHPLWIVRKVRCELPGA